MRGERVENQADANVCQRFLQSLSKVDGIFEDIYAFGCHCICGVGINLKCGADVGVA